MTAARLTVDTNEANGTLYWVVTQSPTAPTAFQVEGGVDENSDDADLSGSQAVSAVGTQTIDTEASPGLTSASGSPAEPMYYAHFMHKDAAGNRSAVATSAVFTVGEEATDPLLAAVVFLSDFEGADESQVAFQDSSLFEHTCTPSPTGKLDSAHARFGGTALYSTNTAAAVSIPHHAALLLRNAGTEDFCMEYSYYQTSKDENYEVINKLGSSGNFGYLVRHQGADIIFYWSADGTNLSSATLTGAVGNINTMYDYCLEYDNADNKFRLFRDGVMVASATPASGFTIFQNTESLFLNSAGAGDEAWIDTTRITRALRYGTDSGYEVATEEFPVVGLETTSFADMVNSPNITLSDDDVGVAPTTAQAGAAFCPAYKSSGKHYFEVTRVDAGVTGESVGIAPEHCVVSSVTTSTAQKDVMMVSGGGTVSLNGHVFTAAALGAAAVGDELCFAVDLDNWQFWVRLNGGDWNNDSSADPATNTGGIDIGGWRTTRVSPYGAFFLGSFASGAKWLFNFGASGFAQVVPTGFAAGWTSDVEAAAGHGGNARLVTSMTGEGIALLGGLECKKYIGGGSADLCRIRLSDFKSSGKYYVEFTIRDIATTGLYLGIMTDDCTVANFVAQTNCANFRGNVGTVFGNDASSGKSIGARADGDVVGLAVDLDNNKVWFRVAPAGNWNGEVIGSQDPANNVGGVSISNYAAKTMGVAVAMGAVGGDDIRVNFGQYTFSGAVPTGFTSGWPVSGTATPQRVYRGFFPGLSGDVYIGDAAADCLVVVHAAHGKASASSRTLSAVSIGGSNGTIHAAVDANASSGSGGAIASRVVTTGGTIPIVLTLDDTTSTNAGFEVWTITGLNSATPVDSDAGHANSVAISIDMQSGGVAVAGGNSTSTTGYAVQGLQTQSAEAPVTVANLVPGSACMEDTPAATGRAITVVSGAADEVAVAASWR